MSRKIIIAAGGAILLFATALAFGYGWRQSALMLVGSFAGIALYHAAFGFTSAWREVITGGNGAGLRAQMLMLAATTIVFLPLIAHGDAFGMPVRGSVAPLALSGIVGAF
ncbi:MAG TPA: YeeE/YedE thiosulfate transporter family protein, partial [Gammaproteobacteria bacterium]|nr:YeeE/YedE thiosulfate transporter family protein [Gammaproteobacteria bacterium]